MTYFQNPFTNEFIGTWVLGDRHQCPNFKCPPNNGRTNVAVRTYCDDVIDLSGIDADGTNKSLLLINFRINGSSAKLLINISDFVANINNIKLTELANGLNQNDNFKSWFEAIYSVENKSLMIKQKKESVNFSFFIGNTGAESVMLFNKKAGVAELPTYFSRHSIESLHEFADCQAAIVSLDMSKEVDRNIVSNAVDIKNNNINLDPLVVKEDWELLEGRSGLFLFTIEVDEVTKLVYHAGAKAGDLSQMIIEDSGNTFVIPYTLKQSDLVSP